VEARGKDASDATPTILEVQLRQIETPADWPMIDVEGGRERSLAAAKAILLPAALDFEGEDAAPG
jgi:predicted kinase